MIMISRYHILVPKLNENQYIIKAICIFTVFILNLYFVLDFELNNNNTEKVNTPIIEFSIIMCNGVCNCIVILYFYT